MNTGILADLSGVFAGPEWETTVYEAGRQNPWFTRGNITFAAEALGREMLVPGRLRAWTAHYDGRRTPVSRRVGIVMAGNLPMVGFADLAAVVATGHRAVVKLSHKDAVLMAFVVDALRNRGAAIDIVSQVDPAGIDALITMGGGEAARHFAAATSGDLKIPALVRGPRTSIAILDRPLTGNDIAGLADDLFRYWGLGCRNVTRLFVPQGFDLSTLAGQLATTAETYDCPSFRDCYRAARASAAMLLPSGEWFDGGFFVLRRLPAGTFAVPGIAEVFVTEYNLPEEATRWVDTHAGQLQCVVRPESFGATQRPGWLDYPDGCDTVGFLLDI